MSNDLAQQDVANRLMNIHNQTSISMVALLDLPEDKPIESRSSSSSVGSDGKYGFKYSFFTIYVVLFVLGLVSNFLVIYFVIVNKRVKSMTNKLIINLSLADLLVVLVCIPVTATSEFYFDQWELGRGLCYTTSFVQGVSVAVSVLTLTTISIDRYFIICNPMKVRSVLTGGRARIVVTCVWVLSALIMSPLLLVFKYQEDIIQIEPIELESSSKVDTIDYSVSIKKCFEAWPSIRVKLFYETFLFGTLFIVPAIVMAFTFYNISKTLWFNVNFDLVSSHESSRILVSNQKLSMVSGDKSADRLAIQDETERRSFLFDDILNRQKSLRSMPKSRSKDSCQSRKTIPPNGMIYQIKVCNSQASNAEESHSTTSSMPISMNFRNHTAIKRLIEGRKRVVKLVILLTFLFLASWLPYHCISLLLDIFVFKDGQSKSNELTNSKFAKATVTYVYPITLCLALANSTFNPLCYILMTTGFFSIIKTSFNKLKKSTCCFS